MRYDPMYLICKTWFFCEGFVHVYARLEGRGMLYDLLVGTTGIVINDLEGLLRSPLKVRLRGSYAGIMKQIEWRCYKVIHTRCAGL